MEEPKRLFDYLTYQFENFPLPDMLAAKEDGQWKTYSTAQVSEMVNQLSASLLALGISRGDGSTEGRDKVAIISQNCPQWLMTDMALQQIGAVSVPVYPNINEEELQFVFKDASVKMVFVGDKALYEKLTALQEKLPGLRHIYSFEQVSGARQWTELLTELTPEAQMQVEENRELVKEEDLATILYTSGTTGTPKGVMLSHRNMVQNALGSAAIIEPVGIRGKRVLSFLPLNHAFERTATYCFFYCGASIYYAEKMDSIPENLREVKPIFFTTVPRLLEKVYEGILAKGEELSGIKRKLFFWALDLAERYEINKPLSLSYRLQLRLADKLIFSKWRAALGGEIKAVVTGAAACQVRLLKIFSAAGIVIQEGYGLTEASPIISGNRYFQKGRMFGTVGPPLKNVEVRIASDGEILCKGPNVMMGYYKRPDLTTDVMEDGWLRTGDIGSLIDDRFLKITDRKKELFKTSGGKYVAPQPIENKMVESPWIEQIMIVGEQQKFVGALVVPAFRAIEHWYAEQDRPYPGDQAILKEKEVYDLINKSIKHYNRDFNHVEQIKKFRLLPTEWTVASGELTPTLKLKRKVIYEKYGEVIDSIY